MTKEPRIQLDSSKLLGFKHTAGSKNEKMVRLQAMVGAAKVGNGKPNSAPL